MDGLGSEIILRAYARHNPLFISLTFFMISKCPLYTATQSVKTERRYSLLDNPAQITHTLCLSSPIVH